MSDLMLHAGGREVTRGYLASVPCPEPEPDSRWRPVPHIQVLEFAEEALVNAGYAVEKMNLGLTRGDMRFFATLTLLSKLASGVSLAVGLRSSLDKSISLQFCAGSRVFVCDNLSFNSEKVIARKHTIRGIVRYQEAICLAVSELAQFRLQESARIKSLSNRFLSNVEAESYLLRCYEAQILSPRTLPTALQEWRTPSFEEFADRSAWSLLNAVTFAIGDRARTAPQVHAANTIKLGAILDAEPPKNGKEPLVRYSINTDRSTSISLAVWSNTMTNPDGSQWEQLSITISRSYKTDAGWQRQDKPSFRVHDLPLLNHLVAQAHAFACNRRMTDSTIPF